MVGLSVYEREVLPRIFKQKMEKLRLATYFYVLFFLILHWITICVYSFALGRSSWSGSFAVFS
jgi:hypothetical protein